MTVIDRIRAAATSFLAAPRAERVERSLSAQRAMDRHAWRYSGLLGKRVANDDAILTAHGGNDLALWRDILDDDRCKSCFQQRIEAVKSHDWTVEGGGDDRKSKKAAEFQRYQLKSIEFDETTELMMYGIWFGFAVGEPVYRIIPQGEEWAGMVGLDRIDVPDRAWFGFGADGELRIIDAMGVRDEPVPERKFWVFRHGNDHSFQHYGVGLAHWLFWPVFFKRQGFPFWLRYLERFGSPTVVGKVSAGQLDSLEGRQKALDALRSVASDGAIAVPDWLQLDLLDAARSGPGGYELLIDRCDAAITRIILSQTMTTEDGSSRSQAEVHMDVRKEITKSDADKLCASYNRGPGRWLTEWNFPGAKPPQVFRVMDEPEDLGELADRDTTLKGLGWHLTPDAFADRYGKGYEFRKPETLNLGSPDDMPPDDPPEFSARDVDAIDRLVSALSERGNEAVAAFIAPLEDKLKGVTNPEFLRIALLDHLEQMPADEFALALADPMLAARAAGEAGIEVERLR
ncbi:MAG TPA: DUF935 family protein [Allosphingosinicella sp.]|nr:DUF935 family protein [Allosphingosinicella sp.]